MSLSDKKHVVQEDRTWMKGTILYYGNDIKKHIKELKEKSILLQPDSDCEMISIENLFKLIKEVFGEALV